MSPLSKEFEDPGNVLGAGRGLWGVALVRSMGVDVLLTTSLYCLVCKSGSSEAGLRRLLSEVFGVPAVLTSLLLSSISSCCTSLSVDWSTVLMTDWLYAC